MTIPSRKQPRATNGLIKETFTMMRPFITRTRLAGLVASLFIPLGAQAADAELLKKIEALTQQLEQLKSQVQASQEASKQAVAAVSEVKDKVKKNEDKALDKWLTVGGDYQFRMDSLSGETKAYKQFDPVNGTGNPPSSPVASYKPKNETMYTNRFGLNLNAKATENVSVSARLMMYKTFGNNDDSAATGGYFADRIGVFDGTIGHIPSSNYLNVDRVYASWNNIADEGIWFSVGRRPFTNGTPAHLRQNDPRPGTGGAPALLVDYAFDGMTLGWAPDIDELPGAFAKICYGRGYEAGFSQPAGNSLEGYRHARYLHRTDRHRPTAFLAAMESRHERLRFAQASMRRTFPALACPACHRAPTLATSTGTASAPWAPSSALAPANSTGLPISA